MPQKLFDSRAVAERYGVCVKTAISYMKMMGCKQRPYRVTASQMERWDESRKGPPVDYLEAAMKQRQKEALVMRFRERGRRQ